ncbi:MAG: hypothetical protein GC164_02985 [Phycisphaera sp.]|nr:hypothetical protein [Phycisphaera sp.]
MQARGVSQRMKSWLWAMGIVAWALPAVAALGQPKADNAGAVKPQDKTPYQSVMDDPNRTVGFLDRTLTQSGAERVYRIWVPLDYDKQKRIPIILYLHDQKSRGIYGKEMMRSGLPEYIDEHVGQFPWIVAIPQALPSDGWNDKQLLLALEVLDRTRKEYAVDEQRVYLVGEEEGAEAAFRLAATEPRRFAAMFTLYSYNEDVTGKFTHLPTWMLTTWGDGQIRRCFASLAHAGQVEARYSELSDESEINITNIYSDKAALGWLTGHTLADLGRQTPLPPKVDAPRWHDRPLEAWFRLDRQGKPIYIAPPLSRNLERARSVLASGRYGVAMDVLQQLIDSARLDIDDIALAGQIMRELAAYRDNLSLATEDYVKYRNYPLATVTLDTLSKQFEPQPQAKAAGAKLKQWQTDQTVQNELNAIKYYDRAVELEHNRRHKDAALIYDGIIKKYPDTLGAEQAQYRLDRLKAEGKV